MSKAVRAVFSEVTLEEILEGGSEPGRYLVGDCSGRQDSQCPRGRGGPASTSESQQGGQCDYSGLRKGENSRRKVREKWGLCRLWLLL